MNNNIGKYINCNTNTNDNYSITGDNRWKCTGKCYIIIIAHNVLLRYNNLLTINVDDNTFIFIY